MATEGRPLIEWLKIAAELKPVIEAIRKAQAGGITIEEGLAIAGQILTVLAAHGVTIAELADLATTVGPLLPLLKDLTK